MVSKDKIKTCCKRAIENVIYESCTDVDLFNRPFEIEYLKDSQFQGEMCETIADAISQGKIENLKLHKLGHVLVPKKNLFDFRKCALTEIYDEIVYLTLVLIIAKNVESARINKNKHRVYSYRYRCYERALLEALDGKLNRGEAIELRDYFYRADNWERRQILKLVQQTIPKSECRPFMKDIAIYTDDIFLNYMKKTYNKTR